METKIYLALSDPKDPPLDCFYTIPAGGVLYLSNRKEVKQKRESIFKRLRACLHGVGEPGLVRLVSFVFTLLGLQNKRNLPY